MCMKSTRHCLPLTRAWSEHKDKEMSLSMRPLHKRKSLYYGCKVRNRAAIGGAIHHIGNVHKYARPGDVPEHTMFVITTDGMENVFWSWGDDSLWLFLWQELPLKHPERAQDVRWTSVLRGPERSGDFPNKQKIAFVSRKPCLQKTCDLWEVGIFCLLLKRVVL